MTTAVEYLVLETAFACFLAMSPAVHNLLRSDLPSDIALHSNLEYGEGGETDSRTEPFLGVNK